MKTTISHESATKIRLTIEASAEELAPAIDRAFRHLATTTKVPGFRPGKAPRALLESRLGKETIREEAIREAVPHLFVQAVKDEGLKPITNPKVDVKSFDEAAGITFEALIEVRPDFRLPDFGEIRVLRPSSTATDAEVDEQVRRLAERFATLETVARPGRRGDFALIDLRGYWNETEIERATATDMLYEIGSGQIVPELDTELDGSRAGDILKFNATLPASFGEEWGGREITFQVLVKETRKKNVPAVDDEFAKTASEFDTLHELREDLRTKISQIKRVAADAEVRNRVLEQLVDTVPLEPPEALVNDEMAYRLARFAESLKGAGLTLDDYLQQTGATEQQIESDLRRQAERNVAAQLVLDEVARSEQLDSTDEEIDEEVRRHAEASGKTAPELRKQLEQRDRLGTMAGDIIRRKALDLIVDKADIRDEDATDQ
jgi:trigger factor